MRVVGENQDESKRPLKQRRTRQETLRKPSTNYQSTDNIHGQTRPAFEEVTSLLKAR